MAQGPIKARPQFTDITSQFTVYSSCQDLKAKTDGKLVYIKGLIKSGTSDQSMLLQIPVAYRPATNWLTGSTFCMNAVDLPKGPCITNAGSELQVRLNGSVEGSGGIAFSMMYPIGF